MRRISQQYRYLLKIFIKLKGIQFFWLLVVFFIIISNNFMYTSVARIIGIYGQKYLEIKDAREFASENRVIVQKDLYISQVTLITTVLNEQGTGSANPDKIFESCSSRADCMGKHFDRLYRRRRPYTSLVEFAPNDSLVVCNIATGGELYCPLLAYLVGIGQTRQSNNPIRFRRIRVFRTIGRYKHDGHLAGTDSQTMCDLEAKHPSIFPGLVATHSILVVASLFFYFVVSTLSCIYDLKGNGFLQLMVKKGLSVRAYWLALWTVTSIEVVACAALLTVSYAAQCPNFYPLLSLIDVFFHALMQFFCIAAFCLFVTVLSASYSKEVRTIGWMAISIIIVIPMNRMLLEDLEIFRTAIVFLLPPGHIAEYIQAVLLAESTRNPTTLYHTVIRIAVVILPVILILITVYLDFVLEGGNGLCLTPGYIFDANFWCPLPLPIDDGAEMLEAALRPASVEAPTECTRPLITINQLSRVASSKGNICVSPERQHQLKNISVTIYESQITAIIGHNGAGKSTLIRIIMGSLEATHGQVIVDGCALNSPMSKMRLRGRFGVCPQMNCLSDGLTIKESINLALTCTGHHPDEVEEELISMLMTLRLNEKLDCRVDSLSSGQKRKLCVALALVGNPKVVIMDEPTNGVDPVSRRRIWKLLQEYKLGRSIILSTHFMDEADTLADRKILLSGGTMICAGSSMFLKQTLDCGFIFQVTLKSPDLIEEFQKRASEKFPRVKLKGRFRNNVELQVPLQELNLLPQFAAFLEQSAGTITAYGLAQPTLADFFMRLRDMKAEAIERIFERNDVSPLAKDASVAEQLSNLGSSESTKILNALEHRVLNPTPRKRIVAVFAMNIRRFWRTRIKLCLRLVFPLLLLAALTTASIIERLTKDPSWQNRHPLDYQEATFLSGLCIYDSPNPVDSTVPTAEDCAKLLNGRRSSPGQSSSGFVVIPKDQVAGIAGFLEQKDVIAKLKEICGEDKLSRPCPVLHTDAWSSNKANDKREINIGMYNSWTTSQIRPIASTVMTIYSRSMEYFAGSDHGSCHVRVEGVDDFLAVFLPLYGAFFQIVIITLIPATYLEDPVEDKVTKVRSQMAIIGVSPAHYWTTLFVVHWTQYAATYLLSVILLICILPHNYLSTFYLTGIVLPTMTLGLTNNLLCVYIVSTFLNQLQHSAWIGYLLFSVLTGGALLILQLSSLAGLIMIYAVPPFATVALTFYGTRVHHFTKAYYWVDGVQSRPSGTSIYFSHLHVYHSILAMACHFCLLIAALWVADNKYILFYCCENLCHPRDTANYSQIDDPGVVDEMNRIDEHHRDRSNLLELRHVKKIYNGKVKAVRDVSFGVMPGEVFGILGPNNAGKTSTLAVIVGEEAASSGECEICFRGQWHSSSDAALNGAVGYCPQHNPLFPDITIGEHLWFYAKLLGIHEDLAEADINILVDGLGLREAIDRQAGELSEGLKRRTCLAASLLGNPSIVIIDDASNGVDPEGKQLIWSIIRSMVTEKRAVITTTHSMEEAEALCTRVAIMNHGLLIGLGSVAQLINLYGELYTLDVQVKADLLEQATVIRSRKERVIKQVLTQFKCVKILEQFTSRVNFSIPSESVPRLSAALDWLVQNREPLQLKHFSFYQLSLDQVLEFLLKKHDEAIKKVRKLSVFSVTTEISEFDVDAIVL